MFKKALILAAWAALTMAGWYAHEWLQPKPAVVAATPSPVPPDTCENRGKEAEAKLKDLEVRKTEAAVRQYEAEAKVREASAHAQLEGAKLYREVQFAVIRQCVAGGHNPQVMAGNVVCPDNKGK